MLKLHAFLTDNNIPHAWMARRIGISKAGMTNLMKNAWPVKRNQEDLKTEIMKGLGEYNPTLTLPDTAELFEEVAASKLQSTGGDSTSTNTEAMEPQMLLKKQTLTQTAKKHFSLFQDPFAEEAIHSSEDVFATADTRYVRESLWACARFGGFMAVISESGGGKSTLRRDLIDRIAREKESVIVIEPYVLGMEDNDRKGKTLKAASIAEAIITTVSPLEKPRLSPEARYAQLHRVLRDSARAGNKHLLVIEEAHSLPLPTLKHLKRFRELEDGFKKLISIVLIGQTELGLKLSESNPEVREVTQRIELVKLKPLDGELENYLKFKFQRVGIDINTIIDANAYAAIRSRLIVNTSKDDSVSLLYPLAINNFMAACLNFAAQIGAPVVNAAVIKGV